MIHIHTQKKKQSKHTNERQQITRKENKRGKEEKRHTTNKMTIKKYISILTLNVNGLNSPTNRHTLAEWIEKHHQYICCLQGTQFRTRDTYRQNEVKEIDIPCKRKSKES